MGKTRRITTPGINVRWPWSEFIANGTKTIETRAYPLPVKYLNQIIAIIETQGDRSTSSGISKARIVALVRISKCYRYGSRSQWVADKARHKVAEDDPSFKYDENSEKWAWVIDSVRKIYPPVAPPKKRGIKYAKACSIPIASLGSGSLDIASLVNTK